VHSLFNTLPLAVSLDARFPREVDKERRLAKSAYCHYPPRDWLLSEMLSSEGEEGEAKCSQRSLTGPDGMLSRALVVGVRCAYLRGARARPKRTIFYVLVDWAFCFEFRNFAGKGTMRLRTLNSPEILSPSYSRSATGVSPWAVGRERLAAGRIREVRCALARAVAKSALNTSKKSFRNFAEIRARYAVPA
jgi:hypothetical protein